MGKFNDWLYSAPPRDERIEFILEQSYKIANALSEMEPLDAAVKIAQIEDILLEPHTTPKAKCQGCCVCS